MTDKLFPFVFFFGGFLLAFGCLFFATIYYSSSARRYWFLAGALCGLLYEGGCFRAASDFGKATGGGGDDGTMGGILLIAFIVAIVWTILIFLLSSLDKKEPASKGDESS